MPTILIVFATRAQETRQMAEIIAEGVRMAGGEARVVDVKDIKTEKDLEGHDALLFGSATYHGDMLQSMKTFLFLAEKAALDGKVGGAFGAFGWSGEAPDRIYDTMKHIFKMDMVSGPLRLKTISLGGGIQMAQDYGRQVVKKFN